VEKKTDGGASPLRAVRCFHLTEKYEECVIFRMGLRNRTRLTDERCFFVTTTCHNWKHLITTEKAFQEVTQSLNFCSDKYLADILGYVVMPNHIHVIINFNQDNHLSAYMRDFKKFTSVKLRQEAEATDPHKATALKFEARDQKFKVWNDRFDDVFLCGRDIAATKLEYMHNNPMQEHWQLAKRAEDYPYSSAAFYEHGIENVVRLKHISECF
jgi:putative transposase